MATNSKVLVVGELLADLISQEYVPNLSLAKTFVLHQGGSPCNFAVQLKKQGIESLVVACVGNDGIGKYLIEELKRVGLEERYIQLSGTFPTSLVLVARSKDTPDFIAYRMADKQILPIAEATIDEVAIVHSCAFALSQEPARASILEAFSYAHKRGKLVSVDWNFAPQIWGQDDGKAVLGEICNYSPLIKFSLDDVARFAGQDLSISSAKDFISSYKARLKVLTCGSQGVWYTANGDAWQYKPVIPVNNMVDATGAGDAFWSGVIKSYLTNESVAQQIENGLHIAALKITGQL